MIYIPHKKWLIRGVLLAIMLIGIALWQAPKVREPERAAPIAAPDAPQQVKLAALLGALDAGEREYYDQMFIYAMGNMMPGQSYGWRSYASSGRIEVGRSVETNGTVCRPYKELLSSAGYRDIYGDGWGCYRSGFARDGWCRVPREGVKSCALEPPRNMVEGAFQGTDEVVHEGIDFLKRFRQEVQQERQRVKDW